MKLAPLLCSIALVACAGATTPAAAPTPPSPSASIAPVAKSDLGARLDPLVVSSHGELGVAYRVLGTGQAASLRGDRPFPMASVYKLPIALAVMGKVERGEIALDSPVKIRREDLSPGWSPLAKDFPDDGRVLSVGELLEAAVGVSDNTASDALLRLVGGARAVDTNLRRLGIVGIRIDQSEVEMAVDLYRSLRGRAPAPTREALAAIEATMTDDEWRAAARIFAREPENTATPDAMVNLLVALFEGRLLGTAATAKLGAILERAKPNRMRAGFPPGTRVAHKTGTAWGSFNDVGVVTLPDGRRVAVAIFLKAADGVSMERGNEIIAEVARGLTRELGSKRHAK